MIDQTVSNNTDYTNDGWRATIRRADWRFLLPKPPDGSFQHLVLLGGTTDLANYILETGLARRVSREIPSRQSADALIILYNAKVTLKDAVYCLVPGGSLYYEIDRWSLSSLASWPGRIQRSLQDLGLFRTGIYWVWPHFTRYKMYLPLDIPGALKWYIQTFFTVSTPGLRLIELALRTLTWFKSVPFSVFARCYSITATAGPAQGDLASILGHQTLLSQLRQKNLRPFLLHFGGADLNRRVVIFPFAPEDTMPVAVLKLSRLSHRNILTESEQMMLRSIRSCLDEDMRQTLPNPLGVFRWYQLTVGVESYAPGRPLSTLNTQWGVPSRQRIEDLQIVADWLARFHNRAQIKRLQWNDPELRDWVENLLLSYKKAFGVTATEEQLLTEFDKLSRSLVDYTLPIVWSHGDFKPVNIFRNPSGVIVIDWITASTGPPLFDLLFFVKEWYFSVRGLNDAFAKLHGFRDLFCDSKREDPVSNAVHHVIIQYMTRLSINHRFFPLLLVLIWFVHAVNRFERDQTLSMTGANPRIGNPYVGYIDVLAEHVEQLFAENPR